MSYTINQMVCRMVREPGVNPLRCPLEKISNDLEAAKVAGWYLSRGGHMPHEEIIGIWLSGTHQILGITCLSRGGAHGAALTAREVLRSALLSCAAGFILAHNHPSGDPTPSPEDIAMTRTIGAAAGVVGIPILDHVVVAWDANGKLKHSAIMAHCENMTLDEFLQRAG